MSSIHGRFRGDTSDRAQDGWVGFIDYRDDFNFPETQVSFHLWEGPYTSKHSHNYYEFLFITQGKTMHSINGENIVLCKNVMCLVKPNDVHQFLPIGDAFCQHLNVSVTSEKLMQLASALSPELPGIIENSRHLSIVLPEAELDYFLRYADQINMCKNNYRDEIGAMTMLIGQMILHALELVYNHRQKQTQDCPDWFIELLEKLHSTEALGYSIADIYRVANYSPPILLKYFRQYMGETIISYFTKIKINYACSLLETTNFTVLDISTRLNYDSLSQFNKVFKRYTGKTPTEYKKLRQIRNPETSGKKSNSKSPVSAPPAAGKKVLVPGTGSDAAEL